MEDLIPRSALSRQRTCAVRCARLEGCTTHTFALTHGPRVRWDDDSPYPSNASDEPRPAGETSAWSGSGNGLPASRKRLVMG